jgi:WD40 repeat protein
VSSLDWHPETNLLLSASTDRGVIVWEDSKDVNGLKPQLAVIKETKSNIDAAWNNLGNKFVVGASSGNVFVGRFDEAAGFWVATSISGKKPLHSQSVTSVRFDPQSGRVVASGSADGKCYITSCFNPETDAASTKGPFGSISTYGETLLSFNSIGWVNFISFSPCATVLSFATHDCEVNFVDVSKGGEGKDKPNKVLYKGNPFLCGQFVNATTYIACGFDKVPFLFKKQASGAWGFVKYLDEGIAKEKQAQIAKGSFEESQVFFKRSETEKASALKLDDDVIMREMNTKHGNYINSLKVYPVGGKLSTSDVNGYINYWDIATL